MSKHTNFPSLFDIYDCVDVDELNECGIVVAVKFTRAKVYYDVLSDFTAEIKRDIPSELVTKQSINNITKQNE